MHDLPFLAEDDTRQSTTADVERRGFLQQMLAAGAAAAGVGLVQGCAPGKTVAAAGAPPAPGAAPAAAPGAPKWDMSWMRKLARHKTAYDSPEIMSGAALGFAASAAQGYEMAFGSKSDFTPVLILRHAASVMVLNDAMWDRLAIGEATKLKDPTSGEPAKRNPFLNAKEGDQHSMTGRIAALDTLIAQGAVVLTCFRALSGNAYRLRQKETSLSQADSIAEILKAVIPGTYVMPNGIFAVSAAQDAGCHYMRVLV